MLIPRSLAAMLIALSAAGMAGAQAVEQLWVDRYDGSADGIGGTDRGFAVAFDSQGNTVVGGYSAEIEGGTFLAIKYAPDGTRLWLNASTTVFQGLGRTMTLDGADNVIMIGSAAPGGDSLGILKLDADGNELWSTTYYQGTRIHSTLPRGVAVDSAGAIYIYGNLEVGLDTGIVVAKYAADGTFLWDLEYVTPLSFGAGIAASDDAVYLVGNSEVASNDHDLLVLKVTSSGLVDWAQTFGRTAQFAYDIAWDVALDSSGNVVAAGSYSGLFGVPGSSTDFAVVRLTPAGVLLSDVAYDGPLGVFNEGRALALDGQDNAVVAGRQTDPSDPGGSSDIQTVKLDPMGNALWDRTYGGLATFTDIPWDVASDHLGGVYVVGEIFSPGPIREYFTIAYDAAGTLRWDQLYGGPANDPSYGLAVAVSADLRVSVTGYSGEFGPFGDSDVATVSYATGWIFADGFESGDLAAWSSSVP